MKELGPSSFLGLPSLAPALSTPAKQAGKNRGATANGTHWRWPAGKKQTKKTGKKHSLYLSLKGDKSSKFSLILLRCLCSYSSIPLERWETVGL